MLRPRIAIRDCASARGVDACPLCDDYPCDRIQALAKPYVTLLGDGQRLREVGIERWIEEQKARQERGFAYVDLRGDSLDSPLSQGSEPNQADQARCHGGRGGHSCASGAAQRLSRHKWRP